MLPRAMQSVWQRYQRAGSDSSNAGRVAAQRLGHWRGVLAERWHPRPSRTRDVPLPSVSPAVFAVLVEGETGRVFFTSSDGHAAHDFDDGPAEIGEVVGLAAGDE